MCLSTDEVLALRNDLLGVAERAHAGPILLVVNSHAPNPWVFEAADGPEALIVWEKSPVHIDLLVTDMVMPRGVTGAELAKTLVNKDPRLRTIVTSGYSSEAGHDDESLVPGGRFLSKPYDPLTLLRIVKCSLDGREGANASEPSCSAA